MCQIAVRQTKGLGALWWKLRVWTYIRLFHRIMLNRWEDGFIVEAMDCPPERLFRPDIAIVAWRRWCELHARGQRPAPVRGRPLKLHHRQGPVRRTAERRSAAADRRGKLPEHEPT